MEVVPFLMLTAAIATVDLCITLPFFVALRGLGEL